MQDALGIGCWQEGHLADSNIRRMGHRAKTGFWQEKRGYMSLEDSMHFSTLGTPAWLLQLTRIFHLKPGLCQAGGGCGVSLNSLQAFTSPSVAILYLRLNAVFFSSEPPTSCHAYWILKRNIQRISSMRCLQSLSPLYLHIYIKIYAFLLAWKKE